MNRIWKFKCVKCSKSKTNLKEHEVSGRTYHHNSKCLSCGHEIKEFSYFDSCGNCTPRDRKYFDMEHKMWLLKSGYNLVMTPQTIGSSPRHMKNQNSCRGVKENYEGHKCLCCDNNIVFTTEI